MTDYPRFQKPELAPDETHELYHGARPVSLVLRLADRWRARWSAEPIDGLGARGMMGHLAHSGRMRASPAHDIDPDDPVTAYDLATLNAVQAAPTRSVDPYPRRPWSLGRLLLTMSLVTLVGLAWWATSRAQPSKRDEPRTHAVAGPFCDARIALP